jgi:hypothetical protein
MSTPADLILGHQPAHHGPFHRLGRNHLLNRDMIGTRLGGLIGTADVMGSNGNIDPRG